MPTLTSLAKIIAIFVLVSAISACGGGGGGSTSPTTPVAPSGDGGASGDNSGDNNDNAAPPERDLFAASRLGARTTFGAPVTTIEEIADVGLETWIEEQFALPLSSHDAVVVDLLQQQIGGDFDEILEQLDIDDLTAIFGRMAWWHRSITAPDQLRQRTAYALSQIFVVSDEVNALFQTAYGTSNYYDMLLENAFGNFRTLLLDVTLHPSMGIYLSHMNNAKGNPETGTFPDENYAREVMQLFSIGLFELNPDGSEKTDESGDPIPTYNNDDIREFAKIFTGLSWGIEQNRFGIDRIGVLYPEAFQSPMAMFDDFHETGEKLLLNDVVVPAGQTGIEDLEAAIDNLFNHPNVPPFIGKQLIQRLVTSNPSPAYVERVSNTFIDNGAGVRGDMRSVIKAILLDDEAVADPDPTSQFGKLREPLLRYTSMLRQLGVSSADGFYANTGNLVRESIQQHPLSAPSVFNFYLPNHTPIGPIGEAGLVAPEFQITNTNSIVQISNLMQLAVIGDVVNDIRNEPFSQAFLNLDDFLPLGETPEALMDQLDLVFTYGTLSDSTRIAILNLIEGFDDAELRVRVAAYLLLISADYAVEI